MSRGYFLQAAVCAPEAHEWRPWHEPQRPDIAREWCWRCRRCGAVKEIMLRVMRTRWAREETAVAKTFDLDGEISRALTEERQAKAAFHKRIDALIEPALQAALGAEVVVDDADDVPDGGWPAWLRFTDAGVQFSVREQDTPQQWCIAGRRHGASTDAFNPVSCPAERLRRTLLVQLAKVRVWDAHEDEQVNAPIA